MAEATVSTASSSPVTTSTAQGPAREALLELKDAGFRYGHQRGHFARSHAGRRADRWIFRHVNLTVHRGEVLAILGRNGVGKSTLLNSLIGLHSLTEGDVHLGDHQLEELTATERARHIAYLPQMEGSGISYTVTEYLLMGPPLHWSLFLPLAPRPR